MTENFSNKEKNTLIKAATTDHNHVLQHDAPAAQGHANKDLVYFVNAIIDGGKYGYHHEQTHLGSGITVEYCFANTPDERSRNGFTQFSTRQKKDIRSALDRYVKFTNLKFREVSKDSTQLDFTFYYYDFEGSKYQGASGYTYYGGNVYLNTKAYEFQRDDYFAPENKGYMDDPSRPGWSISLPRGFSTVLHELGHSLGLKHPFENPNSLQNAGAKSEDNEKYTVMSYNPTDFNDPQQLGFFDIAAAQYLYGVNPNYHSGNNTYRISDKYISDGAGIDTLDASTAKAGVYINLTAGSWLYEGAKASLISAANQAFIGYWTIIENSIGSNYADTIFGNNANNNLQGRSGNDNINGKSGNDVLNGNHGRDTLTGGAGNDFFVFNTALNTNDIDTITDFTSKEDKILLDRTIFSSLAGMKNLNTSSFTANNLGIALDGNDYLIYNLTTGALFYDADANGTGAAIQIAKLKNKTTLHAEDILLFGKIIDTEEPKNDGNTGNIGNTGNTNTIQGTLSGDTISGTVKDDLINGLAGNDSISGKAGKDTLNGGTGKDSLWGNQGNDWLVGDQGNDILYGGMDNDSLEGGSDRDLLFGNEGNDSLNGDEGEDFLQGSDGDDLLNGGLGNDTLYGGKDNDILNGDAGRDLLFGNKGNDSLVGGQGNDFLQGNDGNDLLNGGLGNDVLYGGKDNDVLNGDTGRDLLFGNKGNDSLIGGQGNDFLQGNEGNDWLNGGEGKDILYGGKNDDTLMGGAGRDYLSGNKGRDTYRFETVDTNSADFIADFISGEDRIMLKASTFGLTEGSLNADLFIANATGSAADKNDHILYNTSTGALFFDKDGKGGETAVQFATIKDKPELNATDFIVAG